MQIPFFNEISQSKNILLAGAGGGFDIASGIPLYLYLKKMGKNVVLANLSFTDLEKTDSHEISSGAYYITKDAKIQEYFPEKYILQWLQTAHNEHPAMYGFSNTLGVIPLRQAYLNIIEKHQIDTLVLVDGGTDSLMFGDESGVGTIVEDACSILAASQTGIPKNYLMATGFGVEHFHGLEHYACLENIATLTQCNAFKGALSLTQEMPDGQNYIELVTYLNQKMPKRQSIVANSIASAIQGKFGDYHATAKTQGSQQFINPFMTLLWFFKTDEIATRIRFAERAKKSHNMYEVLQAYRVFRATTTIRPLKKIPL